MAVSIPLCERIVHSKRPAHFQFTNSAVGRPSSYRVWTDDTLQRACEAVHKGMAVRRAAEEYAIPKSTLHDYVSGRVKPGAKSGPKSYLTPVEEEEMVNFLSGMSSLGYSRTVKQIIELVQAAVDKKQLGVTVSPSWWKSFRSRHKDMVLRNPETLTHCRILGASEAMIENYFELLERTIQEAEICDRPFQIFNLDESGFPLNPKPPKVVSSKGNKHPSSISSSERTQITVLACCNAGGYAIPPLVIFDRKMLKPELTFGEVPGTMYGLSDSGWIDSEIFECWFTNHFLVYVPPVRPILLLMDGHSSHFSPIFVNKAAEEQIIVFCLPPNSTHKTQPLDKGVFGPLKSIWRQECHSYMIDNPGKVITRYQFSFLFARAWMNAMIPKNIMAGFRVTGVFPTDRYKLLPKSPPKPPTLCERTGLRFIPLFTPLRHSTQLSEQSVTPVSFNNDCSSDSENELSSYHQPSFTDEETAIFSKRKEEGYDIKTDSRYNLWLSIQIDIPQYHSSVSKLLATLPPVKKNPSFLPKSSARVITSEECRNQINEKARMKAEAMKLKENRKAEREKKKEETRLKIQEKAKLALQKKSIYFYNFYYPIDTFSH